MHAVRRGRLGQSARRHDHRLRRDVHAGQRPGGGTHIPVVIQLGRWRREFFFDITTSCAATAVGDIHLPRTESEGDIPLTAISTGAVDSIECILLKMGVDESEFTGTATGARAAAFTSTRPASAAPTPAGTDPARLSSTRSPKSALLGTGGSYLNYDQIMLPCWGDEFLKPSDELASLVTYANAGGRFFATHFSYTWLFQNTPFDTTAAWDVEREPQLDGQRRPRRAVRRETSTRSRNPKGAVFVQVAEPPRGAVERVAAAGEHRGRTTRRRRGAGTVRRLDRRHRPEPAQRRARRRCCSTTPSTRRWIRARSAGTPSSATFTSTTSRHRTRRSSPTSATSRP